MWDGAVLPIIAVRVITPQRIMPHVSQLYLQVIIIVITTFMILAAGQSIGQLQFIIAVMLTDKLLIPNRIVGLLVLLILMAILCAV